MRAVLAGWLRLLAFTCILIALCFRRYEFQLLVSLTPWGYTVGIARFFFGIDQGSSISPFESQAYQLPFTRTVVAWLKSLNLDFFLVAFADNFYLGVVLPPGNIIVPSMILDKIGRLLRLCSLVVKDASVHIRTVTGGEEVALSEDEMSMRKLTTIDHIKGRTVQLTPARPSATESPEVLGIPLSGTCEWEAASSGRARTELSTALLYHTMRGASLHGSTAPRISSL